MAGTVRPSNRETWIDAVKGDSLYVAQVGTTMGGNTTGFSPLSPVIVPLWAAPRFLVSMQGQTGPGARLIGPLTT